MQIKKPSRFFSTFSVMTALVAVLGLVALGGSSRVSLADFGSQRELKSSVSDLEYAFEHAAQAINPSVVSIISTRKATPASLPGNLPPGFERFFGDRLPNRMPQGGAPQEGMGSGVIVDTDGTILTNNHVVEGADKLLVRLADGRELEAEIVGTDPKTDIAVIKVEAVGLESAPLGDSESARVGQWVLAVGSPFGLSQTVTSGIISAKGRNGIGLTEYENFIQTDASINGGNSGGPLINLKGEVIGINTAILSRSGGNNGIGFAIPVNMAKTIMRSLIETGEITRGWIGISIQNLSSEMTESFGYDSTHGVLVGDVLAGGPAEAADLEAGDIIVALDDEPVADVNALRNRVAAVEPGTEVRLKVFRNGEQNELTLTVDKMPGSGDSFPSRSAALTGLGLALGDLDAEKRQALELSADAQGAVVTQIAPGTPAARAGLRAGDLILQVQGVSVESASEARKLLSKTNLESGVRLRVQRGDSRWFLFLKS